MNNIKSIAIFILLSILGCNSQNDSFQIFDDSNPSQIVKNPDSTLVSLVLDVPIQKGENIVFCASFHLLWDKLEDEINGKVKLSRDVDYLKELNAVAYKGEIHDKDYIALFGKVEKIKSKIIRESGQKFGRTIELQDYPKDHLKSKNEKK